MSVYMLLGVCPVSSSVTRNSKADCHPEGGYQIISKADLHWLSALLPGEKMAEGALLVLDV